MKQITLYLYGKGTFDGFRRWWSALEPVHVLGNDFIEHLETETFTVPDPWTHVYIDGHKGNILHYSAEFRTNDGRDGHLTENADGQPVVCDDATGKFYVMLKAGD